MAYEWPLRVDLIQTLTQTELMGLVVTLLLRKAICWSLKKIPTGKYTLITPMKFSYYRKLWQGESFCFHVPYHRSNSGPCDGRTFVLIFDHFAVSRTIAFFLSHKSVIYLVYCWCCFRYNNKNLQIWQWDKLVSALWVGRLEQSEHANHPKPFQQLVEELKRTITTIIIISGLEEALCIFYEW